MEILLVMRIGIDTYVHSCRTNRDDEKIPTSVTSLTAFLFTILHPYDRLIIPDKLSVSNVFDRRLNIKKSWTNAARTLSIIWRAELCLTKREKEGKEAKRTKQQSTGGSHDAGTWHAIVRTHKTVKDYPSARMASCVVHCFLDVHSSESVSSHCTTRMTRDCL